MRNPEELKSTAIILSVALFTSVPGFFSYNTRNIERRLERVPSLSSSGAQFNLNVALHTKY